MARLTTTAVTRSFSRVKNKPRNNCLTVIRCQEQSEALGDFLSNPPKRFHLVLWRGIGRIIKSPMNWFGSREYWAMVLCAVAYRDDVIKLLIEKSLEIL